MERIEKIKEFLEDNYKADAAHDLSHIQRVYGLAKKIFAKENTGSLFLIEVIALLHDYLDHKFYVSNKKEKIIKLLKGLKFTQEEIEIILTNIENISYKVGDQHLLTIEGKIVQDADRIDAIGAIGIARAFLYGGNNNDSIPGVIEHFKEKLLLLIDKLNTETAKNIAKSRHEFMHKFLEQLASELGD